jgi:hypothetical protein
MVSSVNFTCRVVNEIFTFLFFSIPGPNRLSGSETAPRTDEHERPSRTPPVSSTPDPEHSPSL